MYRSREGFSFFLANSHNRSHTRTTGGDLTLGLRRTLMREGVGYPEVIASLEGAIPTGQSSYGVGGGSPSSNPSIPLRCLPMSITATRSVAISAMSPVCNRSTR